MLLLVSFSGCINIAGAIGDEVYAVADGVVLEVAFDSVYGNVIAVEKKQTCKSAALHLMGNPVQVS